MKKPVNDRPDMNKNGPHINELIILKKWLIK